MKKIVSLVLMVAMLMTSIVAVAEGEKSDFDLDVFRNQMRLDNSGYKQYSVFLDDMEARGFISLNREVSPGSNGYVYNYLSGYCFYVCKPDVYLGKYGTASFYPIPRIWFEYDGRELYTYDTAIFKIGDTTYTFNDIDASYDTSNWNRDTVWHSESVCLCDSNYTEFMDAWIANGITSIKVRLKGNKDSVDFYFPEEAQADTLLMFQNFKDAGGYALLPTYTK